jgi:hypothetical protein
MPCVAAVESRDEGKCKNYYCILVQTFQQRCTTRRQIYFIPTMKIRNNKNNLTPWNHFRMITTKSFEKVKIKNSTTVAEQAPELPEARRSEAWKIALLLPKFCSNCAILRCCLRMAL